MCIGMKLLNLTFPCSPREHIHVNVNTEDCGLEDASLSGFFAQIKQPKLILWEAGGDELGSFKETKARQEEDW